MTRGQNDEEKKKKSVSDGKKNKARKQNNEKESVGGRIQDNRAARRDLIPCLCKNTFAQAGTSTCTIG